MHANAYERLELAYDRADALARKSLTLTIALASVAREGAAGLTESKAAFWAEQLEFLARESEKADE